MPLSALALVLTAALLHALWNIAAKRAGGDVRFAFITAVLVCLLWLPLAGWFAARELHRWGWLEWLVVAASAAVHTVYFLTLLKGYRKADLTVVYPVARGSAPLVTVFCAVALLGEPLSATGLVGVLTVCAGVFLIAGGPRLLGAFGAPHHDSDAQANTRAHTRARARAGVAWGAATGILIAGYSVIDAYAVKVLLVGPILLDYVGNLLRLPILAPMVWRHPEGLLPAWRQFWKPALVVAVFGPLGYVLVLYALTFAPLSHVAPARELSTLLAALLGGKLLGEGDRSLRIVGAGCIAVGIGALAWPV
jgi:drug/metabolite transporter (DMT)-like permease